MKKIVINLYFGSIKIGMRSLSTQIQAASTVDLPVHKYLHRLVTQTTIKRGNFLQKVV